MIELVAGKVYHYIASWECLLVYVNQDNKYYEFKAVATNTHDVCPQKTYFGKLDKRFLTNIKEVDPVNLPMYAGWKQLSPEYFKLVTSLKVTP